MIFDASMKIKMRLSTPLFSLVVLCSCIVYGQSQWQPLGEVTAVEQDGGLVRGVVLDDGQRIDCGVLVNAAGPSAGKISGSRP